MRSVIVSDIHLGRYKYGKMDASSGLDFRTIDILRNIDKSIEYAIEKKANTFIIAGDFYHIKRPAYVFRQLLAARIEKILSAGIKLYLLLGNHDQGKTFGHDLVELREINKHIGNLFIIDKPTTIIEGDTLLSFLPFVNKIEYNLKDEDYYNFHLKHVRELSEIAKDNKCKYKLFFAHFGTDQSQVGKSFDLGSSEKNQQRVVPLAEFKSDIWTKVYLGDIHKQQELNDFVRHVGSIARVDFGEELEDKGFYFYEDGKDKFIKLSDRIFKTLDVDLMKDARETMGKFCDDIQDLDLSESITRLKVKIKSSDRLQINFKAIEEYLREQSWTYIGKTITEVNDELEDVKIESSESLNHIDLFEKYMISEKNKIEKNIFSDCLEIGRKTLSELLNFQKR